MANPLLPSSPQTTSNLYRHHKLHKFQQYGHIFIAIVACNIDKSLITYMYSWRISIDISWIYIIMFISIDDYSAYVGNWVYE